MYEMIDEICDDTVIEMFDSYLYNSFTPFMERNSSINTTPETIRGKKMLEKFPTFLFERSDDPVISLNESVKSVDLIFESTAIRGEKAGEN